MRCKYNVLYSPTCTCTCFSSASVSLRIASIFAAQSDPGCVVGCLQALLEQSNTKPFARRGPFDGDGILPAVSLRDRLADPFHRRLAPPSTTLACVRTTSGGCQLTSQSAFTCLYVFTYVSTYLRVSVCPSACLSVTLNVKVRAHVICEWG